MLQIFIFIDLHFLILAIIAQVFNPVTELVIPIGISTKEAKAETETHAVVVKDKIRKCSI